jgi:hypothetical protein
VEVSNSSARPTRAERRAYCAAENRLRESIELREALPNHTYPRYAEDLETIRNYHSKYGIPDLGLWARARRLIGG